MRSLTSLLLLCLDWPVKCLNAVLPLGFLTRLRVRLLTLLFVSGRDERAIAELRKLGPQAEEILEQMHAAVPPGKISLPALLLKRLRGPKRKKDRAAPQPGDESAGESGDATGG